MYNYYMEDEPNLESKTSEAIVSVSKESRIGPVAVWKFANGVITPAPGYENTRIFSDDIKPLLYIVEAAAKPTLEEQVTKGWESAQRIFESHKLSFGTPDTVHDLSVDRFTARTLAKSDYTAMVSLRSKQNLTLHPELIEYATQFLQGRGVTVRYEDSGDVSLYFNIEEANLQTHTEVTRFAYTLGWLSGTIPLALVYRYRNFSKD